MDLCFREYTSPFSLFDLMIETGQFSPWINKCLEEHEEKIQWEVYLHKVYDKSFIEFKESLKNNTEKIDEKEIETTINTSYEMLNYFDPTERGSN